MRLHGLLAFVAAFAALAGPARAQFQGGFAPQAGQWKALLISGDAELPVFDNAVQQMAMRLNQRSGIPYSDMQRLSTDPRIVGQQGIGVASLQGVWAALGGMNPGPGQGCFVFVTSHGAQQSGIVLAAYRQFLNPYDFDRALAAGCGTAPTIAVISGCYTGNFAQPPVTRPNRVILTAARPDRTSFGCGAGYTYTVFDSCLLQAMDQGGQVRSAFASVLACVSAEERREGVLASQPQAYFGPAVGNLAFPGAGR